VDRFDVVVAGAGIVGASCALALAATHRVLLLETEAHPGYHTTGRSAALFEEAYGPPVIRKLTKASRDFLTSPPEGFAPVDLLSPRGSLFLSPEGRDAAADAALAEALPGTVAEIPHAQAMALCPAIEPGWMKRALYSPDAMDMDVDAIHRGYLRAFKAAGGTLLCDAPATALDYANRTWRVETPKGTFQAPAFVDAAGAWADRLGAMAGAAPIGLVPKRRTAFVFETPYAADELGRWPMVIDIDETFYIKPEAGLLLASPADETPSEPCDAQPEEIDIAECAARVETATRLRVARIRRKWAGLRCFVADKCPVLGPDDALPGFHWAAAPGGYGIMTSPAVGRTVAAGVRGEDLPADIAACGVAWADVSCKRLAVRETVRG
jgi:D-arginine dehydrogenase